MVGTNRAAGPFAEPSRRLGGNSAILGKLLTGCFPYGSPRDSESSSPPPPRVPGFLASDTELVEFRVGTPQILVLPDDLLLECFARIPRASIGPLMGTCRKWRSMLQGKEYLRLRESLGRMDCCLFVFSKELDSDPVLVQMLRPTEEAWNHAYLFEPSLAIDDNSGACSLGRKAVLLGGLIGNIRGNPPVTFDPWTHSMQSLPHMGCPRTKFVCGAIGEQNLYVAGGLRDKASDPIGRDLRAAEVYSVGSDRWQPLADMGQPRVGCFGGVVGGKLYVIGGTRGLYVPLLNMRQDTALHNMEVYDPASNNWQLCDPIPRTGFVLGGVVLGPRIFIMRCQGGRISWLRYHTVKDTWRDLHPVPIPSNHMTNHQVQFACAASGDKIYVIQVRGASEDIYPGSGPGGGALVLCYDPRQTAGGVWTRLPDMPMATKGALCASLYC